MVALPLPTADELLVQARTAHGRADYALSVPLAAQLLSRRDVTPEQRLAARQLEMGGLYRQGDLNGVVDRLDGALAEIPVDNPTDRLELLRMGSLACGEIGRYEEALRHAHEAVSLAGDDAIQRIYALNAQASCYERMGDPWQAARLMDTALALTQDSEGGLEYPRLLTLNNLSATLLGMFHILRDAGEPEEAADVLRRAHASAMQALPLARQHEDAWPIVFVKGNLAEALVHLGEADEALDTLGRALTRARAHGFIAQTWALRCTWGEALLAQGRHAEAQTELESVMAEIGIQRPVAVLLRLHHALHRAHAAQGSVAHALHHLEQYLALERRRSSRQLQAQSRLLVTRVEMERARQQAERARGEARRQRRRADALADAALHDALTGLLNRRGLEERVAALVSPPGSVAVVMADVDHFKRVNDVYGHAVGDAVLERLARLMRAQLRPEDVLARFGGEEFTLLLAGLDCTRALEVCERLRQAVERENWVELGLAGSHPMTISIGVAMLEPGALDGAETDLSLLLSSADEALYRAKRLGRNRVEMA